MGWGQLEKLFHIGGDVGSFPAVVGAGYDPEMVLMCGLIHLKLS